MLAKPDPANQILTTQDAARLLGVSVSSIKNMVEKGVLEGWKTSGGHRRIRLGAVQAYLSRTHNADDAPKVPVVLVVEDNAMQLALLRKMFELWELPLRVQFCDSGYSALLAMASNPPDILLTDVVMEGIDGAMLVRTVLADVRFSEMQVAVITGLNPSEMAARASFGPSVTIFHKPINGDELRGYLKAASAAVHQRLARS